MATKATVKTRDLHLHIEPEYDKKLSDIKQKIWKDQNRGGEPSDIGGFRHAITLAHGIMFPK